LCPTTLLEGRVTDVNVVERAVRATDRAQQRNPPAAFAFGLIKKFGDDRGGALCALLAFYGFLSLFPLLLLLVTVLGFLGGNEHSLVHRVESSAFSQFPIVGTKLSTNIHALRDRSVLGLVVGILGVLWGSQGAMQTAQFAQAEIWNVPGVVRPSFWARLGRTACMILVLGTFLLASTVLAGIVTIGHHGALAAVGAVALSVCLNIVLFCVAFRVLTPRQIPWRNLMPGALAGGAAWTVLQYLGGILVEHSLRNTSKEYGTFALVLGLVGFLYIAAQISVYAAELNVVRARHLWPRSLVQPPLTSADKEVLSSLALEGKRRPEQYVATGFRDVGRQSGEVDRQPRDVGNEQQPMEVPTPR
jgi:YihY family inner membrane protein